MVDCSPKRAVDEVRRRQQEILSHFVRQTTYKAWKNMKDVQASGFEVSFLAIFAGPSKKELIGSYSFDPSPSALVGRPWLNSLLNAGSCVSDGPRAKARGKAGAEAAEGKALGAPAVILLAAGPTKSDRGWSFCCPFALLFVGTVNAGGDAIPMTSGVIPGMHRTATRFAAALLYGKQRRELDEWL